MTSERRFVVGIDLGTTNSVVAILDGSQPEIIANATGARTTPSVVSLGAGDEWLVGDVAKRQLAGKPDQTVYSVKRLMGMRLDEVGDEVATKSYKIVKGEKGMAFVEVKGASVGSGSVPWSAGLMSGSSPPVSAASPSPTSRWPRPPTRSSSASTFERTLPHAT